MEKEKKNNIFPLTEFLEVKKIQRETIEIGGKSAQQLERELNEAGIRINQRAQDMLRSHAFTTLPNPQTIETVALKVRDFGFQRAPTTEEIYQRATESYGLELCPAEVGLHLRLKDKNQPLGDWYSIAMQQLTDRRGMPHVFDLSQGYDSGRWLGGSLAFPIRRWLAWDEFVFRLPKDSQLRSQ